MSNLPCVAGNYCTTSIAEFEHKCLVVLAEEQRKLSPDSHLVGLLCDAVRLGRELAKSKPGFVPSGLERVMEYCQEQKAANALASPGIILDILGGVQP